MRVAKCHSLNHRRPWDRVSIMSPFLQNVLNPHPYKTITDKISLRTNPADMQIGKIRPRLRWMTP
jgi:hypothetical protein